MHLNNYMLKDSRGLKVNSKASVLQLAQKVEDKRGSNKAIWFQVYLDQLNQEELNKYFLVENRVNKKIFLKYSFEA
jgi:hypothetical protein